MDGDHSCDASHVKDETIVSQTADECVLPDETQVPQATPVTKESQEVSVKTGARTSFKLKVRDVIYGQIETAMYSPPDTSASYSQDTIVPAAAVVTSLKEIPGLESLP